MPKLPALLFAALLPGAAMAAEETLPAYNTYQSVPFVVGEGGLANDLVGYLNNKLKGKYHFKLTQMPREALNKNVIGDPGFKGAVLFLSPPFVEDAAKTRYLWTQPLLHDSNAVISLGSRKLEYTGPDSFKGLKFGAVRGNRYMGLEDRFGKDIQKEEVGEELSNIKKLAAGKIDATIMANSTFRFLMQQMGKQNAERSNLYTSSKTHMEFDRHIFVARDNPALGKELDAVVAGMKGDPAWKAVLAKYGLE
ncbi:MAG TPA: transporter substrate-binding domain-containing protein [Burkholderiaceae bacterium]|nr:transporter substrate-binding domain-containing protein [Burkholderiaceae bacterium]